MTFRRIPLAVAIVAAFLVSPAYAQLQTTPNYRDSAGQVQAASAVVVLNPDGTASSASTRTTAAGTSDTQAVPVQGVAGGVPQNVAVQSSVLPTGAATQTTLAAVAASVAAATPAGTNTIGNVLRATYWNESTTPPAASGQVSGAQRDSGSPGTATVFNTFSCFVRADQAGTLDVRGSPDGTILTVEQTQAVSANTSVTLTTRTFTRYHYCRFTAGATAPTSFVLNSQLGE